MLQTHDIYKSEYHVVIVLSVTQELASLGLDRLKSALLALGLKCGGWVCLWHVTRSYCMSTRSSCIFARSATEEMTTDPKTCITFKTQWNPELPRPLFSRPIQVMMHACMMMHFDIAVMRALPFFQAVCQPPNVDFFCLCSCVSLTGLLKRERSDSLAPKANLWNCWTLRCLPRIPKPKDPKSRCLETID